MISTSLHSFWAYMPNFIIIKSENSSKCAYLAMPRHIQEIESSDFIVSCLAAINCVILIIWLAYIHHIVETQKKIFILYDYEFPTKVMMCNNTWRITM